jgi:RES domain
LEFYRVFDWDGHSSGDEPGGPLYVPRDQQRQGRHDIPDHDGILYACASQIGAIAEVLQGFRGSEESIGDDDFKRPGGLVQAWSTFELSDSAALIDLDDPVQLAQRSIRPSQMATSKNRDTTRAISLRLYEEGTDGFLWWSVLEGSWINVSLFQSRVLPKLTLKAPPEVLSTQLPALQQAASVLDFSLDE